MAIYVQYIKSLMLYEYISSCYLDNKYIVCGCSCNQRNVHMKV